MLLMQPFKIVETKVVVLWREREREKVKDREKGGGSKILNQYVTDSVDIVACRHK